MTTFPQLEVLDSIIHNPATIESYNEISRTLENDPYDRLEEYASTVLGSVALFHLATNRMALKCRDGANQLLSRGARVIGDDRESRQISASIDLSEDITTPLILKINNFYSPALNRDNNRREDSPFGEIPVSLLGRTGVADNAQKAARAVLLSNWFSPLIAAGDIPWPSPPPTAARLHEPPRFKV